jgi:hypothetical protein
MWYDGLDWNDLDEIRDQWRTVVNMVMEIHVPQKAKNILTS